jgi:hypothetical protein
MHWADLCNCLREIAQAVETMEGKRATAEPGELELIETMIRDALLELVRGLCPELELDLVELGERERLILATLGGQRPVPDVLRYLAASMCDGVRRPGSWERGCVAQLFGHDRILDAEAEIEDSYQGPPYREVD